MTQSPALRSVRDRSRALLARGRTRTGIEAQDAWDRFIASDPGLVRLRLGLRAMLAVGTTLLVQIGAADLVGVTGAQRLLHLMLGSVIALNTATTVKDPLRRDIARAAVYTPAGAVVGATLATLLGLLGIAAGVGFVVLTAGAVWVRRYGGPWFACGFVAWQAYFLTSYLHPPASWLPGMLGAAVVSTVWVSLLLLTVLYDAPQARLTRTVTALRARARSVVSHCLDVLRRPGQSQEVGQLRRELVGLTEVALLFDAQLAQGATAPSRARLRRWIIDVEISCEELAAASVELTDEMDRLRPETRLAVLAMLERLGWSELESVRHALAELGELPHRELPAVRRLTNAGHTLVTSMDDWRSGRVMTDIAEEEDGAEENAPAEEEFHPVVRLTGDALPGSAAMAERTLDTDDRPRGPLARLAAPATWSLNARQSVQAGTAALLAIAVGELISPQRYYWAVIAAFIAFTGTTTSGETVRKSLARIVGTMAGLVAAFGLAELTAGHPLLDIGVILGCLFLAFYLLTLSYAAMIFFITLTLGELYGILRTFSNTLLVLRLLETAAGAAAGIVVALVVLPTSTRSTLIVSRRALMDRLAELLQACAEHLRGRPGAGDLLADAVALDEAARQVLRTSDSFVRVRLLDPDHGGRRHRVAVLVVAATNARALVPPVLAVDKPAPPALAAACDVLADEARRLASVGDLRDHTGATRVSEQVVELLEGAPDPPPTVLARRLLRLADALALLTPRGRG